MWRKRRRHAIAMLRKRERGMIPKHKALLGVIAAALLGAGVFVSMHRPGQSEDVGGALFPDLQAALGDVTEIRMSRGDGSRTTLVKNGNSWLVSERNYPADPVRVREMALGMAALRVVEHKTSVPGNYPKLGVEAPDSPTATEHAGGDGVRQADLVTDRGQGLRQSRRVRAQAQGRRGDARLALHQCRSRPEAVDRPRDLRPAGRRDSRDLRRAWARAPPIY